MGGARFVRGKRGGYGEVPCQLKDVHAWPGGACRGRGGRRSREGRVKRGHARGLKEGTAPAVEGRCCRCNQGRVSFTRRWMGAGTHRGPQRWPCEASAVA